MQHQHPGLDSLHQQHMHMQCAADPYAYRLNCLERRIDMLERMIMMQQQQTNDTIVQLRSMHWSVAPFGAGGAPPQTQTPVADTPNAQTPASPASGPMGPVRRAVF